MDRTAFIVHDVARFQNRSPGGDFAIVYASVLASALDASDTVGPESTPVPICGAATGTIDLA
jgi:hypothetical protein